MWFMSSSTGRLNRQWFWFKTFQETWPQLKVWFERLVRAGDWTRDPWVQVNWFIHYTMVAHRTTFCGNQYWAGWVYGFVILIDRLSSFDLFLTNVYIKRTHQALQKNNNFDNRRIARTCVLGAQKELFHRNTSLECLKHNFTMKGKTTKT